MKVRAQNVNLTVVLYLTSDATLPLCHIFSDRLWDFEKMFFENHIDEQEINDKTVFYIGYICFYYMDNW